MTAESVSTIRRPADVGLKREMGLIGATWASETSIIGSGWLFGAFGAAQPRTRSPLDWVIGGIAVIILALVHAELGGMFPVAGGTARSRIWPSAASPAFVRVLLLAQAVTVAPIECFAVMQYGSYYSQSLYNAD